MLETASQVSHRPSRVRSLGTDTDVQVNCTGARQARSLDEKGDKAVAAVIDEYCFEAYPLQPPGDQLLEKYSRNRRAEKRASHFPI